MKHSDLLLIASGTATLEAGFFETPMIIVYKVSPLTYFIGRLLVKVKDIGLVNIIAGRRIVPEFLQGDFTTEKMLPEIESLITNQEKIDSIKANLAEIKQKMGEPGAAKKVADVAFKLINQ